MSVVNDIQSAIKAGNVIMGYNNSLEFIKNDSPKLIVMANNIPDSKRDEVERDARLSGAKVEVFDGSSKDLGVICGKPFPVSLLVITK